MPRDSVHKMDSLPPELLLKIAGYCDFTDVCALSKVNRQWNGLIKSNWNSLKKLKVKTLFSYEYLRLDEGKNIFCSVSTKDKSTKLLSLNVAKGSENVDAAEILENNFIAKEAFDFNTYDPKKLRPMDDVKFLEDLFAPIFQRSTIDSLELVSLKSPSLQVIISLLERFRPTITWLDIAIGGKDGRTNHMGVQELMDYARIVELSNPQKLTFCFSNSFTEEEVCENFLKAIEYVYIPRVFQSGYFERHYILRMKRGPVPKCDYLLYKGSIACIYPGISAFAVPDIVDLVEEWCNNKRDIGTYVFDYFVENIDVIAKQFEQMLKERTLPIRLEVVVENAEFLIKKIATRGDEQDRLRINFGLDKGKTTARLYKNRFVIMHTGDVCEVIDEFND